MASFQVADGLATAIYNKIKSTIFNAVYPVGSIYLSDNTTNPSTKFGGTWTRLTGGFLYGSTITTANSNTYSAGNGTGTTTNGNNGNTGSTAITVAQMPAHSHTLNATGRPLYWDSGLPAMGGLSSGDNVQYTWDCGTQSAGGGQGHTHTLNNHSHGVPYMAVSVWRRTA